jgi:L-aminopeptidase/D-esterase-like protein
MAAADSLTAIAGLKVGHWTDSEAVTGCTVVLCEEGAVAGADIRGGAPGTRETDLLRPGNLVERVHAVLLTGGSAFGLDAAGGVMRWLEEKGIGYATPAGPVPIVVGAVLYDLNIGRSDVRPNARAGYAAAAAATSEASAEGSVGAGTGATVAKALGMAGAVKGGLGSACEELSSGVKVAALVALNAFGEVLDPATGQTVAGPRADDRRFVSTLDIMRKGLPRAAPPTTNTTIAVVATDAELDRAQCTRLAAIAHDGIARAVRPAHSQFDGDSVFALATGKASAVADLSTLGAFAALALERAILGALHAATSLAGVPALADLPAR